MKNCIEEFKIFINNFAIASGILMGSEIVRTHEMYSMPYVLGFGMMFIGYYMFTGHMIEIIKYKKQMMEGRMDYIMAKLHEYKDLIDSNEKGE